MIGHELYMWSRQGESLTYCTVGIKPRCALHPPLGASQPHDVLAIQHHLPPPLSYLHIRTLYIIVQSLLIEDKVIHYYPMFRPVTRGVCLGSGRADQATARVGSQTGRVAVLNVLSDSIFFETTDEQMHINKFHVCFYFSGNLSI